MHFQSDPQDDLQMPHISTVARKIIDEQIMVICRMYDYHWKTNLGKIKTK